LSQTTKELKICGAVGHLSSLEKKGPAVAETEIGIGGTSAWRLCGVEPASTYAIYFEVANQHSNPVPYGQQALVQFVSTRQMANGHRVMRVTTVCHGCV
jgi:protein transport protein SEC23